MEEREKKQKRKRGRGHDGSMFCDKCGATMVEYPAAFNKGLARVLLRLYEVGRPAEMSELGLAYSQRTNEHKLRYWGLAEQYITEETKRKRGCWVITQKGKDFVEGKISIPRHCWTYRNEVVEFDGQPIRFSEVSEGYRYRQDFIEQRRPHNEPTDDPRNN